MRRDVCYFFPVSVDQLYNAYLAAASNSRFRRDCNQEPYHTLGFGLNFSMKYNFNGGGCILRFIPCEGGSAVNMRFSIAQLAGARYEKYAQDLTDTVASLLGVYGQRVSIDVEYFLAPENQIGPTMEPMASPAEQSAQNSQTVNTCPNCGRTVSDSDKFCMSCGTALSATNKICANCGTQLPCDAAFCSACGNKV